MRARSSALDGGIHLVERAPLATDPTSTMRRTPHDGHAATAVLGAILVLSTVLRFGRLGHNSLWFDEAYTALLTQHTWHHILEVLRTKDTHPPLYFFMMKGWAGLTGISEVALRIPSAAFAVLSVGLTYALVRRLASEPVSLLGVFLVAISPIQIMIGQEAKMYTLLGVLAIGSTLALLVSVERGGVLRWLMYTALSATMVYTQYLGVLVLAAHGVWIATYERRHARFWLAAMLGSAILFAPWATSFWYQVSQGHGWPWYRSYSAYVGLPDLVGLFAFGGSLFGMGTYFAGGSAPAITQAMVLVPFLVLVGLGVRAFASSRDPAGRRSLVLLGLPVALVVMTTAALSFANKPFYPRWAAFLSPFFTVLLAQGIYAVAERVRPHTRAVLSVVTAAVLLLSTAVLSRYYLDPIFRLYRWRDAAALVKSKARPSDYVIYANSEAALSFSYYFRDRHNPSLILTPMEAQPTASPTHARFTTAQAKRLAVRYPRVWIISTPPMTSEIFQRLVTTMNSAYHVVGEGDFALAWVYFLEANAPAGD